MSKQWLAVITQDMFGKQEQVIKEVEVEAEGDKMQFVRTNFPDMINYAFRATKGGAEHAMKDLLNAPGMY